MDGVNFLALVLARIFKGELGDPGGSFFGDDLQALDHAGNHFMLKSGIKTLGIFADDDKVHIGIARGNMRQVSNGPEVGVQLKLLAQRDVDAGKTAPHRRRHRPLQSDAGALDRLDEFFGNVLA